MNMNEYKGKRLIAAVAVLALIACAFVAFIPADGVNGALDKGDAIPGAESLTDATATISTGKTYYVNTALEEVAVPTNADVTFIIGPSGSISFSNTSSMTNVDVKSGIMEGTSIYAYAGLEFTGVEATNTFEGHSNGGIITADDTTSFGIKVGNQDGTTFTYYPNGADVGNVTITGTQTVTIIDGTATIINESNRISFNSVTGANIAVGVSNTELSLTVTTAATAGTISVLGGVVSSDTNPAGDNAVLNAVANQAFASGTKLSNAIDVSGETDKFTYIYGTYTIRGTVGTASTSENKTANQNMTLAVDADATLVVSANANLYVQSMDNKGAVKIFGNLYGTAWSSDDVSPVAITGNIQMNANGYVDTTTVNIDGATVINTNITSGTANDYMIHGVPSSSDVGDAILDGDLIIPAGMTFTVNGNLGLNGHKIIVDGTLAVDSRANIYGVNKIDTTTTNNASEGIYIQGNGSIQNNGAIGKMMPVTVYYAADDKAADLTTTVTDTYPAITMQGVSGVSYSIDKTGKMTVSGNITATSGAKANNLTIANAQIGGDFTTAKKVILKIGSGITIAKNAAVVFNGDVEGSGAIKLSEGASVSVNGKVASGITITADVGLLKDNTTFVDGKKGTVTITNISNVAGFTMYVKKVGVANESTNTTDYYLRAYVNGTLAKIDKTDGAAAATITVNGNADYKVYVAAEETLTAGEDVKLTMSNVMLEGTVVIASNADDTSDVTDYIGAKYKIETAGENNSTLTTTYYTTLAAAMGQIANVNDEGITAVVNDLDMNVTVADGQLLNLTVNGTIAQDAVLTVENGGTLEGTIAKVDGKMVVQPEAYSTTPSTYDVISTSEDGTVTYAGIAVAIAEAQPGDKITVGSPTIGKEGSKQSLTIPQGVEVTVTGTLTIYGDLTVANEATLIGGTIDMARPESKVTVNGTLDMADGSFLHTENFQLTSNGTTVVSSIAGLDFNGAYYAGDDGTVITTVTNAVAYATENQVASVNVHGTVSNTAALTLDGVNLVLDQGAKVTLGDVTLSGAYINAVASGAELTAAVSALNGEGDAAANGTVALNKSNVTVTSQETVNAAGTNVYTYIIGGVSGTMTVQAGTAVINGTDVSTAAGSKLTVASGATLLIAENGKLTVTGEKTEFTVDGTLDVEGTVDLDTTATSVINGTMDITGTVEADKLVINGTVNVVSDENDEGTFTVTGTGVTVGDVKQAMGSTGSIVGVITLGSNYVIAYAGTDMSGAKLANDAEFETTAFYVNDALYATVYAATGIANTDIINDGDIKAIPGIAQSGDFKWTDANGVAINSITGIQIGQYEAVYVEAPLAEVTIKVSVGTGISLYIDNVKVDGPEYKLTVGTHTVSATVNPGYAGEATISFDGQTVTGGSIEITVDSAGVVLAALGDISVDTGSTGSSDDGMGLTEILLVILVILIVVMAIMVALRLMRS